MGIFRGRRCWLGAGAVAAHAVLVLIGAPAIAGEPPAGVVEVARERAAGSFAATTNGDVSALAWTVFGGAQDRGMLRVRFLVDGVPGSEGVDIADGVTDDYYRLTTQVVARPDGRFWVVYVRRGAILGKVISVEDPVGEAPVVLVGRDDDLVSFRAAGRPDGGVFLSWHFQSAVTALNHQRARAFDSSGKPVGPVSDVGGAEDYTGFATANDGSALMVTRAYDSYWGLPYESLVGYRYGADGEFLSAIRLTPNTRPGETSLEDFDVTPASGGGFWLTWFEGRGSGSRAWARRVTTTRVGRALPARPDPVGSPSATTPDDGFLLAWAARGKLIVQVHGPGGRPDGASWVLAEGLPADLPPGYRVPLQLATDGRGHFLVAWWGPDGGHGSRPLLAVTFEMP